MNGAHLEFGHIAIHYLTKEGDAFKVTARLLNAGGGDTFGKTAKWEIRYDLDGVPDIWTNSGFSHMGCSIDSHDLIRLSAGKPELVAQNVTTSLSREPEEGEAASEFKVTGKVIPIKPGEAFNVSYSGRVTGTLHYQYVLENYDVGLSNTIPGQDTDQALKAKISC
ncbi:MAG: hypothetical protein KGL21_05580 [Alphaproteobacteria bacterium]|nr:hypothetical protein [Alphaproteobacteria bacterium]